MVKSFSVFLFSLAESDCEAKRNSKRFDCIFMLSLITSQAEHFVVGLNSF